MNMSANVADFRHRIAVRVLAHEQLAAARIQQICSEESAMADAPMRDKVLMATLITVIGLLAVLLLTLPIIVFFVWLYIDRTGLDLPWFAPLASGAIIVWFLVVAVVCLRYFISDRDKRDR